jgi:hypothetical protein
VGLERLLAASAGGQDVVAGEPFGRPSPSATVQSPQTIRVVAISTRAPVICVPAGSMIVRA